MVDQDGRDDVEIDLGAGRKARAGRHGRGDHAAAVDQGQRAVGAKAIEVGVIHALAEQPLRAVGRNRAADAGAFAQGIGHVEQVAIGQVIGADGHQRFDLRMIGHADAAAGDENVLAGGGGCFGCALGRGLSMRAAGGKRQHQRERCGTKTETNDVRHVHFATPEDTPVCRSRPKNPVIPRHDSRGLHYRYATQSCENG